MLSALVAGPLLAGGTNVLTDEKSRVSYALGLYVGHSWQQQGVDVDLDTFTRGVKDLESGGTMLMSPQEMRDTLTAYQKEMTAKQQQMREIEGAKNKAAGEAFLANNKNNSGVVALPDGLQYQVITTGTGAIPTVADTVSVNYSGKLLDGTEFDSSYKRGKPATFPVTVQPVDVGQGVEAAGDAGLVADDEDVPAVVGGEADGVERGLGPGQVAGEPQQGGGQREGAPDAAAGAARATLRAAAHQRHHQGSLTGGDEQGRKNRSHQIRRPAEGAEAAAINCFEHLRGCRVNFSNV